MNTPLISIISVTYNAVQDLDKTLYSVVNFLSDDVEYIIIDGGSVDGTVESIKKIESNLAYWISEKDSGIYDAMNKGIRAAKGKYIYFINAGDTMVNLPFSTLKVIDADLICFPVELSNGKNFYPFINWQIKIKNTLPHQGCFYRNNKALVYDIRFKIFADFALNQLLYKKGKKILTHNYPIVAYHSMDGISHHKSSLQEIFQVVENNYGVVYMVISRVNFKLYGLMNKVRAIAQFISKVG